MSETKTNTQTNGRNTAMGLDLYLYTQSKPGAQLGEQLPRVEVAYFRKFNALIKWVDTHVQKVTNCEDIMLDKKHLQTLLQTLEQLTGQNCGHHFPTTEGFFFGSTQYDAWYWQDVGRLRKVLKKLLKETDFGKSVIYFYAWW